MMSDPIVHGRAQETALLLESVVSRITDFLAKADTEVDMHKNGIIDPSVASSLVASESLSPDTLASRTAPSLLFPISGIGRDGVLGTLDDILRYSVNTSCPGFMDKLYGSPLPPGVAAELVLAVLNTNLHVYQVSPMLTLIEKHVTKALAGMFGFKGPRAGGISVQGGSASNLTSIVAARNSLFPQTKARGNTAQNQGKLTLFTSAHGHYSIEKAAQALGLGSENVIAVPVDKEGRMLPDELDRLIMQSKSDGFTPFYINATAGSTVLGSFDPFDEIAGLAKKYHCWLHIDGAWGGGFIFADRNEMRTQLRGVEKADSIAFNPHKMLGVPMTCSFLLTRDLRLFQAAMTLKAGYLFHDVEDDVEQRQDGVDDETREIRCSNGIGGVLANSDPDGNPFDARDDNHPWEEPYDLADLTLQCGRRGDSLKLFMSWQYYGTDGYRAKIENAHNIALQLAELIDQSQDFSLVLGEGSRPACLQVCFYYTPGGKLLFDQHGGKGQLVAPASNNAHLRATDDSLRKQMGKYNTMVTSKMSRALIRKGFMIDFAPALEGQEDMGSFFRVVINISTIKETTHRLLQELREVGSIIAQEMKERIS